MEAFVTPIILSYVQKYVNLRPQDAQLSLWEGDAVFQNLDLRLDVLQSEFQLPFEFLSGHIHELIIHIPWTKITSEPISITINTIEFVLKLKELDVTPVAKSEKSKSSQAIEDTSKGYINSLVDKIVKNISITCNNIILKYVEEDIVVSMNIQLLSFCSADSEWKPAFIDVGPTKVVLRRLMHVTDLTICLDKRNSAGQIDVCQEPILYKCSLQTRIVLKYTSNLQQSTTTTIEVFTNSLELNISSQQFPMVMRLVLLALSLKSGKLQQKYEETIQAEKNSSNEFLTSESMLSWAWSKVPSIFPPEDDSESTELVTGNLMKLGVYVANFGVTLKSLEIFADNIVQNTRKIRYNPIMRINLNGNYFETHMQGFKWFDARAGISQLFVEPLGNFSYRCQTDNFVLFSSDPMTNTYLKGSLFDLEASPNADEDIRRIKFDYDKHIREVDETYLFMRSPAAAFDMLHFVDVPDSHAFDAELDRSLEYSDLHETTIMRVYFSGLTLKHNATVTKIIKILTEMIESYDYPPYVEKNSDDNPAKLPPPLMDDFDALMNNIPRKTLTVKVKNLRLEIHPLNQSPEKPLSKFSYKKLTNEGLIPFIAVYVRKFELENVAPLYENRLVHTTCQLPDKPKELLDASYTTYIANAYNLSLYLVTRATESNIMEVPKISVQVGCILKEACWGDDIKQMQGSFMMSDVQILFSRPQEITLLRAAKCLFVYNRSALLELGKSSAISDASNRDIARLDINIRRVNVNFLKFRHALASDGSIDSIEIFLVDGKTNDVKPDNLLLFEAPKRKKRSGDFMMWKIQLPRAVSAPSVDSRFVLLRVQESRLIIHPNLEAMLLYEELIAGVSNPDILQPTLEHRLSHISVTSERLSKKTIQPDETIHVSSDKDDKYDSTKCKTGLEEANKRSGFDTLANLSDLVFSLEIDQCEIIFPNDSDDEISMMTQKGFNENHYILVKLPSIKCKSANSTVTFDTQLPIHLDDTIQSTTTSGFSWNFELSELYAVVNEKGVQKYILMPIKTTITMAFDSRDALDVSNFRINLHLDTAPIVCNVYEDQIIFLKRSTSLLASLQNFFSYETKTEDPIAKQSKTSACDDDLDIKEFLAINSNSEFSHEVLSTVSKTDSVSRDINEKSTTSIWLQWTFTKITLNFYMDRITFKSKLALEMEDFITSIDKENVYFKLKSKIGAFSVRYFYLHDDGDWMLSDDLKVAVQLQTNENERQNAFLDLTLTIAEVKNVFKKWGTHTKSEVMNTLSEVVLHLKAIEFQLSVKGIEDILPLVSSISSNQNKKILIKDGKNSDAVVTSVANLPLMHFDCKGLVFYIPAKDPSDNCDVLILRIGHIKIRPNAENPLTRIPIRPDVYTKAEQLRILHTPGSRIEDRQYELIISNISAVTSTWSEMLSLIKENENVYNTNPAVEWNNLDKKPAVTIDEIFKNFVISIIYAPCVLYKTTLICGQSIELNCVTDLIVDVTIAQLLLINNISNALVSSNFNSSETDIETVPSHQSIVRLNKYNKYVSENTKRCDVGSLPPQHQITPLTNYNSLIRINRNRKGDKPALMAQNLSENINTDSGFASAEKTCTKKATYENGLIPYDISLVAGEFIFKVHEPARNKANTEAEQWLVGPLLSLKITQPSMLITRKLYEYTVKYSIFSLILKLGTMDTDRGSEMIFETKTGNVNSTGIVPPLISVTYRNTITNKIDINFKVGRPVRIHLCENALKLTCNIKKRLYPIFESNKKCERIDYFKPIVRGTTIRKIRNALFNADILNVSSEQLQIECIDHKEYALKAGIAKSNLKIDNFNHPEYLHSKLKLNALFVQTSTHVLLHPLAIECDMSLKQEHWNKFPVVNFKMETNVLHLDINPKHLLRMMEMHKNIIKAINEFFVESSTDKDLQTQPAVSESNPNLKYIPLPHIPNKEEIHYKDEFFQDDLRAGAFQIVEETSSRTSLPLPYQMRLSINEKTICWRYPHPRSITKLLLYPILVESTKLTNIQCCLQYFNDVLEEFVPYLNFSLSERETQTLKLPEIKVAAFVWKVVVSQKSAISSNLQYREEMLDDSTENQEDENSETVSINDFFKMDDFKMQSDLNLKTLIGCIRVDSSFQPDKIPVLQALLRIPYVQINLQNEFEFGTFKCPPPIQHFRISNDFYKKQTFASIILSKINIYTLQKKKENYITNFDVTMACRLLDYGFLNMLDLLEPTNVKGLISYDEKMNCNLVVDTMRFNFGPGLMHTLLTSKHLWLQVLNKSHTYIPLISRYVVCNMTNLPFQFGQTSSDELILLKPNECSFYAFRNDHLKHCLTFVFERNSDRESCVLEVTKEGTQYLELKSSVMIATFEKLSSTQVCIFIKGQLELLSMSKEHFQVQHFANGIKEYLDLGASGHGSFVGEYKNDSQHFMRLKLVDGKGWSGEIPLVSKNIPWLVKLPSSNPQDFISFWVRVIEEEISSLSSNSSKQKRMLILIWPMFIVRSFLPKEAIMKDVGRIRSYKLEGQGSIIELGISGDNNSGHEICFEGLTFSSEDNDANMLLTYKGIDRNRFFETEGKHVNIDVYLNSLKKPIETNWPFSQYETSLALEASSITKNIRCVNRIVPSRKFSSGIMLEILPWCMFLNSTGKRIKITDISTDSFVIVESNTVTTLPIIKDAFKIEICCGSHWADSWSIYINESSYRTNTTKSKLLVPEKGAITFYIYHASTISRFVLTSYHENNARVLKLASAFAILNFSNVDLDVLSYAFEEGCRITEKEIVEILNKSTFKISCSNLGVKPGAIPIDVFEDATGRISQKNAQVSVKHYICLMGHQSSEMSLPMQLSKAFSRKCFNIFNNNSPVPLVASVIERDNQFVMSIFNDKSPKFEIKNFTDLTFFVAGTKSADSEKSSKIMAELNEKSFDWYQKVNANSSVFYTPPELYSNFPDAEYAQCNLSFALCLKSYGQASKVDEIIELRTLLMDNIFLDVQHNIRWSKPLKTESSRETLLNVPLHGDVKILVCNNHKTTKVSIFYITQGMEFSVKELRTRLSDQGKFTLTSNASVDKGQKSIHQASSKDILEISCTTCSAHKPKSNIPNINIFVKEASVSIFFDSKDKAGIKQDILSIYLDEIAAKFDQRKRLMSFVIRNVQLDNQLYVSGKYDFPVLFCAEKKYSRDVALPSCLDLKEYLDQLKVDALLELRARFYDENLDLERINCKISAARAYIEDTYLNDLLDHFLECDPSNAVYIYEDSPENSAIQPGNICVPIHTIDEAIYLSSTLQLKLVKIEPINLMLSVHTCVRLYIALDHSPLYFSEFERRHVLTLPVKFGNAIGMHYLSGAIFGAGWVVGSLEILGSPGGLARSVSTGLKDFVSMPVQGLCRGPWGFLAGITQGSASLVKNVTAGTVNSVTKLAASVARNLDRLTLDDEHLQRTEALRRLRPQGVAEGLSQGLSGLGISLLGALGGLARHPLEARSSVEVMTGVAKGIVGAFTKPLSGAAELLALTGQGMLHTVGFNTMPQQRNAHLSKNIIAGPADCKLAWKYLPTHSTATIEQLLFYHDVTLINSDQFKRAIVAMTRSSFIILEYSQDCPAEIFPIERIDVSVDTDDKTLVEIKVLQTEEYNEEADSEFFNNRLISFLRDSSDNLPATSTASFDGLLAKSSNPEKKYKLKRRFYINECLVPHFVSYFIVLKHSSELFNFPSH